jgi:hypothetical protein
MPGALSLASGMEPQGADNLRLARPSHYRHAMMIYGEGSALLRFFGRFLRQVGMPTRARASPLKRLGVKVHQLVSILPARRLLSYSWQIKAVERISGARQENSNPTVSVKLKRRNRNCKASSLGLDRIRVGT